MLNSHRSIISYEDLKKKHLHCTIPRRPKIAFSRHLESKYLCCSRDLERFYLVGLNNFLEAARCMDLVKCFKIFHFN